MFKNLFNESEVCYFEETGCYGAQIYDSLNFNLADRQPMEFEKLEV